MIEQDWDPWLEGKEESDYLKALKKLKGQNKVPIIVLSTEVKTTKGGRVHITHGGFSPSILSLWGTAERAALVANHKDIYLGSVRILAHALLCACNGDEDLAIQYLHFDKETDPDIGGEIAEFLKNKQIQKEREEQEKEFSKELNRQMNNKPRVSE